MNRGQLHHILRAAAAATGQKAFVVVGSAAIFAWRAVVPEPMMMSREADVYPDIADLVEAERISDELDTWLGQASDFDAEFGYYLDGVGPNTAILPHDWRARAKLYQHPAMEGVTAVAPEPNDLALAKLCPGRAKDMAWLVAAARARIIDLDVMEARIGSMPPERIEPDLLRQRLVTVRARAAG